MAKAAAERGPEYWTEVMAGRSAVPGPSAGLPVAAAVPSAPAPLWVPGPLWVVPTVSSAI